MLAGNQWTVAQLRERLAAATASTGDDAIDGGVKGIIDIDPATEEALQAEYKYAEYVRRIDEEVAALRRQENVPIPLSIDYDALPSLSNEERDVLRAGRPATLGDANRLRGLTPSGMMVVLSHCLREEKAAKRVMTRAVNDSARAAHAAGQSTN
jgi:tRNA U34 5-carboxymethylaminomethyl modifying enzyme MnmG/GidA